LAQDEKPGLCRGDTGGGGGLELREMAMMERPAKTGS
jgi:hypothetical protein